MTMPRVSQDCLFNYTCR